MSVPMCSSAQYRPHHPLPTQKQNNLFSVPCHSCGLRCPHSGPSLTGLRLGEVLTTISLRHPGGTALKRLAHKRAILLLHSANARHFKTEIVKRPEPGFAASSPSTQYLWWMSQQSSQRSSGLADRERALRACVLYMWSLVLLMLTSYYPTRDWPNKQPSGRGHV